MLKLMLELYFYWQYIASLARQTPPKGKGLVDCVVSRECEICTVAMATKSSKETFRWRLEAVLARLCH